MSRKARIRAKKSYSQNFLADKAVVKKIIAAADIKKGEIVLEIGPGTGILTEALVKAGAKVIAVEADPDMTKILQEKFSGCCKTPRHREETTEIASSHDKQAPRNDAGADVSCHDKKLSSRGGESFVPARRSRLPVNLYDGEETTEIASSHDKQAPRNDDIYIDARGGISSRRKSADRHRKEAMFHVKPARRSHLSMKTCCDTIQLIEDDILSLDVSKIVQHPYKLVANLPYSITSAVLKKFLTEEPKPGRMVLMVQKEVADRIVAKPPDMSLLSVVCQLYADCKKVTKVPAEAFRPKPKVDSAVVRLDLKNLSKILPSELDSEEVIQIAKQGFSARRKQLHGNLSRAVNLHSEKIKEFLAKIGQNPKARAENLSINDWIQISQLIKRENQVDGTSVKVQSG